VHVDDEGRGVSRARERDSSANERACELQREGRELRGVRRNLDVHRPRRAEGAGVESARHAEEDRREDRGAEAEHGPSIVARPPTTGHAGIEVEEWE
jgi:hypothetical protein